MPVTLHWIGHSTYVLEANGKTVLMDPFITNNPLTDKTVADFNPDVILLTHAHGDHVGMTQDSPIGDTLAIAQASGATIIANFEIGNYLMGKGLDNVMQGNPGGTLANDFLSVKFTKAFHSSSFADGTYGGQPNGFVIRFGRKTIYNAGDTSLFGDMELIGEEGIDLALLPIGDVFTMGVDDSIKATKFINPQYVMPMHYNTFPPIAQDVSEWAERINRETSAQPIIIDPGSAHTLE
jgi:L-ascorbate metabolism protein UlaG (beta-lactamase superfamily)